MSEEDFKKTYNGFTKFVLWGTLAVVLVILVILCNKKYYRSTSVNIKVDLTLNKSVSKLKFKQKI